MSFKKAFLAVLVAWMGLVGVASAREEFDEAHRFLFYAVLEGCYEDGLSTEEVAQVLLKRPGESYFHFIYSCPICTPIIHALEAYRSRPEEFYSLKSGASTFGRGLGAEVRKQLFSAQAEERLAGIHALVQGWVARRFAQLALSAEQREGLQKAIEEKRKRGMEALKRFQAEKFENGERRGEPQVLFYAPAYAALEECAVCNAAVGKELKMPGAR